MIGTTRPQLNLFMNKFRKLGFIEYSGEIKVNDSGQEARLLRSRQGVYEAVGCGYLTCRTRLGRLLAQLLEIKGCPYRLGFGSDHFHYSFVRRDILRVKF